MNVAHVVWYNSMCVMLNDYDGMTRYENLLSSPQLLRLEHQQFIYSALIYQNKTNHLASIISWRGVMINVN